MASNVVNHGLITVFGALFMLSGIVMIIAGSVGLYNDGYYYTAKSWALLWGGITMELIGSSLFAIARRMKWREFARAAGRHQHQRTAVVDVECVVQSPACRPVPPPRYSVSGYTIQPLGVPPAAAFPTAQGSAFPTYEFVIPPVNQPPPPYENPK